MLRLFFANTARTELDASGRILLPDKLKRHAGIDKDVVIVGDTPEDVACGRPIGARAVAVATGFYDVATLRAAGADRVFETLADTAAVLDALLA